MHSDSPRRELRQHVKDAAARRDAVALMQFGRHLLSGSDSPADAMLFASSCGRMGDALNQALGLKKLRTYIVRSVTVEPIIPFLTAEALLAGYSLDIKIGGYGSFVDELMNPGSGLAEYRADLVLIILDLEDIAGNLPDLCARGDQAIVDAAIEQSMASVAEMLRSFRSTSSARVMFQGLELPDTTSLGDVGEANLPTGLGKTVQRMNERLRAICTSLGDCVFFDVDLLAARAGRSGWRDTRMFLASRLPVAAAHFGTFSRGIVRSFSTLFRAPRKILCTDLDNTLWGGVLGEDGVAGIATGSAYPGNCYWEYQKYLKQLSSRGILLAIVSKNNEADVREAFQLRSSDIALRLDDFVAIKISWNQKADAIRELSHELSLGLDSFVFIDDNPVECEAIRQHLPVVAVIQAPVAEPWRMTAILAEQTFFDAAIVTEDDLNRHNEYRSQAQRAELARSSSSRDDFLASMGIICSFQSALLAPLPRAVQLLAKTNQFNLTTRRRSAAEVEEFSSVEGGQAVVVRVRDRFGDAGVVGLALARTRNTLCHVDSLLLSCRVIGRGIESALLSHLAERALLDGAKKLVGEFIETKKNIPCATFYPDHGFIRQRSEENTGGSVFYELDLTEKSIDTPGWITVEGTVTHELSASTVFSA